MGLDTVELVLEVEEAFGIGIPDDEAVQIETPGQLIDYVHQKTGEGSTDHRLLPGMRAFFAIRNACVQTGIGTKREIRPSVRLDSLFAKRSRPRDWHQVGKECGFAGWPDLHRPKALVVGLILISTFPNLLLLASRFSGQTFVYLFIATWIALFWTGMLLTRPFRNRFPPNLVLVRDLVMVCLEQQPSLFLKDYEALSRDSIAAIIRRIVCHYCSPSDYREDAHFVRDLGLD